MLVTAACRSKPPARSADPSTLASGIVDAGAPVDDASVTAAVPTVDAGTRPWVTLDAPAFREDTGNMPGPKWDFSAPGLPAIDRRSGQVYVPYADLAHLSSTTNFAVRVRTLDGDRLVRTLSILTEAEFHEGDAGPLAGRQAKYRELEARARGRIAQLTAELDALSLEPMTRCSVSDPFERRAESPFGCEGTQRLTCGALKLTHKAGGQLAWSSGDAGRKERNFPRLRGAPVRGPPLVNDDGGVVDLMIPANDCFTDAYVDARGEWIVGAVSFFCQGGGDGCSASGRDVVLPLR